MKSTHVVFMLICMVLFSCSEQDGGTVFIDCNVNRTAGELESLFSKSQIRLVPLETGDDYYFRGDASRSYVSGENIFVWDLMQNAILRFDKNGKYLNKIARQGEGPEEYLNIYNLGVHNERLYVLDNERVKVYDFEGNYVKDILFQPGKGGGQIYVSKEGQIFIGRSFKNETQVLVYEDDGTLVGEYLPPVRIIENSYRPLQAERSVGDYNGGVYMTAMLDYTIYHLKDTLLQPIVTFDFGNKNYPSHFFEGTSEEVSGRLWYYVGEQSAVVSLNNVFVTKDWLAFNPGYLSKSEFYYNRKTQFYFSSASLPEPYQTLFGNEKKPHGYNEKTGEFYMIVNALDLKSCADDMADGGADYLEKYPFLKGVEQIDEDSNDWIVFFKL